MSYLVEMVAAYFSGPNVTQNNNVAMKWNFTDGKVDAVLGSTNLVAGLVPGYRKGDKWRLAHGISIDNDRVAHQDRLGKGMAHKLQCKLGAIDAQMLLIEYDNGSLGAQMSLTNKTSAPITLDYYSPLMTSPDEGHLNLAGHPSEWRVYIDSGACGGGATNASYGLNENSGFNEAQGVSVLWSSEYQQALAIGSVEVERSLTYIAYEFGEVYEPYKPNYYWAHHDHARLRIRQDALGYRLDPGETFTLDEVQLIFDTDPFKALTNMADAMVAFNQVRKFTDEDAWVGWMTWYNQPVHMRNNGGPSACKYDCATEEITREQCQFIKDSGLIKYGVRDIEIDDGFQKEVHLGDWLDEFAPTFPSGMEKLGQDLRKIGMNMGIWLALLVASEDSKVFKEHPEWFVKPADEDENEPFHTWDWYHANPQVRAYELDATAPGAIEWICNQHKTYQQWGYHFSKNDFSGALIDSERRRYHNRKMTGLMRWRWTWRQIKAATGGSRNHLIQICGANNIGGIGIIDNVRSGDDICVGVSDRQWKGIKKVSGTSSINRWWQNGRFFITDPDNLEVAEYKDHRAYPNCEDFKHKWALSFEEAHVRAVIQAACAGNLVLGDRLTMLEPERIAIIKKVLPRYGQSAVPLDMFEQTVPCLLWNHVVKEWGSWDVLSVINYDESALIKEIPLSKMGLDPHRIYVAWEFWGEQQMDTIQNGILRVAVKPHSVKTIRITSIAKDQPQLVGTSFHLMMGAMEVSKYEQSNDGSLRVRIVRPAVEEGRVYFWSPSRKQVICETIQAEPDGTELQVR